jgi:hypothetical protein
MAAPEPNPFCDECDISLDLHYGDDDCEGAEQRARLVESFPFGAAVSVLPEAPQDAKDAK